MTCGQPAVPAGRLPGHIQPGTQLPQSLPVAGVQAAQQPAAAGAGQRLEYLIHPAIHNAGCQHVRPGARAGRAWDQLVIMGGCGVQARGEPGHPDRGHREGQRGGPGQPPGSRAPCPDLLGQHQGGQANHDSHVHHTPRDQDHHQRPAAAQAVSAVMGADAQVAEPAPVGAVVQEQPERGAAVREAAVLQAVELVHTAHGEDRHGRDVRGAGMLPGQPAGEPGQPVGRQACRRPDSARQWPSRHKIRPGPPDGPAAGIAHPPAGCPGRTRGT
jgi:hypothetical protein